MVWKGREVEAQALHRGRVTTRGCVLDVDRFYIALFPALEQTAFI